MKKFLTMSMWCQLLFIALSPADVMADPVSGLVEDAAMSFGTIVIDPAGDVITLTSGGGISAQNSSILTGSPVAAEFSADGDANAAASISFSSGDTLTGVGTAMPLGIFTHNAGMTPAFNGSGNISFSVGATLTVNTGQVASAYSGTYTVFVDYL